MINHPVLYSYRRCPYAMRARMAIYLSGIQVEQREIVFWEKPEPMLEVSPKGTVPILVLPVGQVIDESRDIMFWAFEQAFSNWVPQDKELRQQMDSWIERNDGEFKEWLDRYKYADRHPEQEPSAYRHRGEQFLQAIEQALSTQTYLLGNDLTMADIALFPFIRQFVNVDKAWFETAYYPKLKSWLLELLESRFFLAVMKNRPTWVQGHQPLWLNEPSFQTRNQFLEKACGDD